VYYRFLIHGKLICILNKLLDVVRGKNPVLCVKGEKKSQENPCKKLHNLQAAYKNSPSCPDENEGICGKAPFK
jgi:hypothetical protein